VIANYRDAAFASRAPIAQSHRSISMRAPGIGGYGTGSDAHQVFALVFGKTDN